MFFNAVISLWSRHKLWILLNPVVLLVSSSLRAQLLSACVLLFLWQLFNRLFRHVHLRLTMFLRADAHSPMAQEKGTPVQSRVRAWWRSSCCDNGTGSLRGYFGTSLESGSVQLTWSVEWGIRDSHCGWHLWERWQVQHPLVQLVHTSGAVYLGQCGDARCLTWTARWSAASWIGSRFLNWAWGLSPSLCFQVLSQRRTTTSLSHFLTSRR